MSMFPGLTSLKPGGMATFDDVVEEFGAFGRSQKRILVLLSVRGLDHYHARL